jgi:hypothetical protein
MVMTDMDAVCTAGIFAGAGLVLLECPASWKLELQTARKVYQIYLQ